MSHSGELRLQELVGENRLSKLKQIASGLEFKIYLSRNERYVVKVPRLYTRMLGLANYKCMEMNILLCRKYIADRRLSIVVPDTWLERYRSTHVIVQEYVRGERNVELTKKLIGGTASEPIEESFMDMSDGNIIFCREKAYLVDVAGGFYFRVAQRFGKRTSRIFWHCIQIGKICVRPAQEIIYQEHKIYRNRAYARFLRKLGRRGGLTNRMQIIGWHIDCIYRLF